MGIITTSEDGKEGEMGQGKWLRMKAVGEAREPGGRLSRAAPLKQLTRIKPQELS